jgi:hypothetical protein
MCLACVTPGDHRTAHELVVLGLRPLPRGEQVPYIAHSDDPLLGRILNERWKHEDVLAALP